MLSTSPNRILFLQRSWTDATLERDDSSELEIKNQNIRTLNILSAASSSGEELYSIAILLSEILPESIRPGR
ncbi:MAG: hypothetical protein IPN18_14645 [Ignavibacteriales bacterium]|nr:hypothetical protein [Ignavibacteriales bacterium]